VEEQGGDGNRMRIFFPGRKVGSHSRLAAPDEFKAVMRAKMRDRRRPIPVLLCHLSFQHRQHLTSASYSLTRFVIFFFGIFLTPALSKITLKRAKPCLRSASSEHYFRCESAHASCDTSPSVHFRWVDIVGERGGQKLLPHGYAQVVSEM
jgi:hypothetical protein